MAHISLYRKYRSQTFDEIIGQEPIVTTLKNAVANNRLSHAYLFTGPRGTGKTSTARIFAKALNCSGSAAPNPCGKCDQCVKITSGHALNVIEIDAASNRGIDEIRDLREKVRYKPVEGKFKVYIIDEVHMLTPEAFNALLKTLEEPPSDTVFILATTEPQKVPVTISSRCQRFDFGRIALGEIVLHLKSIAKEEGFDIEESALELIARSSEGAMRDAISLIDQLMSFCEGKIKRENVIEVLGTAEPEFLFEMGAAIGGGSEKAVLSLAEKAVSTGVSIPQLTKDLIYHFRNLMLAKIGAVGMLELPAEQIEQLQKDPALFSLSRLKDIIKTFSRAETDMKWHQNARLVLEVALLELCGTEPGTDTKETAAAAAPVKAVQARVTVPVVPSPASGQDPDIEDIRTAWKDILMKMKSKSLFGFVSLSEAEPSGIDPNGRLVLRFKKGYSFHKSRVEEQQNKSALEESIKELTGRSLSVKCEISEAPEAAAKAGKPAAVSVDDVVELFDGKLVS